MGCHKCWSDYDTGYYKYKDISYCLNCLISELKIKKKTVVLFYNEKEEIIANDENIVDFLKTSYKIEESDDFSDDD